MKKSRFNEAQVGFRGYVLSGSKGIATASGGRDTLSFRNRPDAGLDAGSK